MLVGPGLGMSERTRGLVEALLTRWRGPVVLDADALNVFAGDAAILARLLDGRPALLTPHVAEFARLAGGTPEDALARRFDAGLGLASALGSTVLLKGVPTVISEPGGRRAVSAAGTAALATGGSGDLLGGIAATLLAHTGDAFAAAACAAWVHGRAAELATRARPVRGTTLDHVLAELPNAWTPPRAPPRYPALATVPRLAGGEGVGG